MDTTRDGILKLGRTQYLQAVGYYDLEKDDDGFVVLKPTASRVDQRVATLTTDINTLEQQLRKFKAEKAEAKAYQKTEEYKESKKAEGKKKKKKAKENILNMVFNNADAVTAAAEAEEEEEGYRDSKKKGPKKPKDTTRDTTLGKRYEPIISMLYDSVSDFERIAAEIDAELETNKTRNMYRSTQIGNLLSAKDKKMMAIKELRSIADKITDYEYKEKAASAKTEESDTSKAVSNAAAKYLRGAMFGDDDKGKKGKKKDREESSFKRQGKKQGVKFDIDDDDDDDDWEDSVKRKKNKADADDDEELAKALAGEINKRGGVSFTSAEKYSFMEGKYRVAIVCDPANVEKSARVVAVNPKTSKIISDFKDKYPGLLPKMKEMRLSFDIGKKRAVDKNSGKRYPLLFRD